MRIDQAKAIHMDKLLAVLGCQPEREKRGELWYTSPFRPHETYASFVITADRRAWYDHGRGAGGNILDFVMAYYSVNVSGALGQLDTLIDGSLPPTLLQPQVLHGNKQQKSAIDIQEVQEIHSAELKHYMKMRGIPLGVGRQWLKEIRFTLDDPRFAGKEYYALGFANQSGGWEIRNRYYQGCTGKDITLIPARNGGNSKEMAVFEGFMDFLSAVVYTGRVPTISCIVLNSSSMKQRALKAIRRYQPETVHLYLDNDQTGRELVTYFQEDLGTEGIEVENHSSLYEKYKDFNELLVATKQGHRR